MPTIQEATKGDILPGQGERPDLQIWMLTLSDGKAAEMLRKPGSPAPTGEVTVQETAHGLRAKLAQTNGFKGSKGSDAGRNASMAVSYAKDLVIADKIEIGQLSAYAEKFYDFIESKGG